MDWNKFADEHVVDSARVIPGSASTGLTRTSAMEACRGFLERDVCVLGGDLYIWNGVKFHPSQGWGVDRQQDEPWPTYLERSITTAITEIERERDLSEGEEPIFVLVCSTEIETAKRMYGV